MNEKGEKMKKKKYKLFSIVLSLIMVFSVFTGLSFNSIEESHAADNWIKTEVEVFNDAGSENGGKEVLEEVSRILGEDYGSRLYGTKLAIGGAEYIKNEFAKYCDVAGVGKAETHYHPNNTSHDRYPGTIYPENHRIHGVVEFGNDNTTASVAVGRAIPAYDSTDLSEYAGAYQYSNPEKPAMTIEGKYFENDTKAYTGEFVDFGTLATGEDPFASVTLPNTGTWSEEKDVYGAIRLTEAIDAADIAALENHIEAVDRIGNLTGLYIASTIEPAPRSAPYGGSWYNATMNRSGDTAFSVPYVLSDIWKAETEISAISMTLSELNKVVVAGKAGKIQKSYRVWPEYDYSPYGIIKAETDNPDLVLLISGHIDNVTAGYGVVDDGGAIATEVELARRLFEAKKAGTFDNGNIEIIFAAVGGEEHSDFNGMYWIVDNLIKNRPGILQKTINLNMDQVSAGNDPDWNGNSRHGLNVAYGFDETWHRGISLPLHLVVKNWAEFGKFESQPDFIKTHDSPRSAHPGNDNAVSGSEYIENFSLNHGGNKNYHSSLDNMDPTNYSLERHQYSTNLMHAAILRAVKDQVSKRATFNFVKKGGVVTASLDKAAVLFKTYDKITAEVVGNTHTSPVTLTFTPEKTSLTLPIDDYKLTTETKSYTDNSGIDKSGTRGGDKDGKVRSFTFDNVSGYLSIDMNDPELKQLNYTLAPVDDGDNPSTMTSDFVSKLDGEIKVSTIAGTDSTVNQTTNQDSSVSQNSNPQTSDSDNMMAWILLGVLSILIAIAAIHRHRQSNAQR